MLRILDYVLVALTFLSIYIIRLYYDFRRRVRLYRDVPGFRLLFSPASGVIGTLSPKAVPGVTLKTNWIFNERHRRFKEFGQDAILSISAFPQEECYFVSDATTIKEIAASRMKFPKAVDLYDILGFFGKNILVSEQDDWKRFRKIASPSFNEKNNALTWEVTSRNLTKLFDEHWGGQKEVVYEDALGLTVSLALFVISAAGFGRDISWEEEIIPQGHKMSFKSAIDSLSTDLWIKLVAPDALFQWAPTKALKRARDAFEDMELYMKEMIKERRSSNYENQRSDLLSNLIAASELEDEKFQMTDSELISNVFIFLIAGHETTGHTLCFVLANLALHQDEQEALFQHIQSVLPDGRLPTYKDMNKLTQCMDVFYETLRMFPSVPVIPKKSAEDTTMVVSNEAGDKIVVPVFKGTRVHLHVPGLHYNPRYWDDPYTFKPSRFRKEWPKDAFIPFSVGARACIGRGFFETTAVAFISLLVLRYKIEVLEEPQFSGETFEERKARVLEAKAGLTLTPIRTPLVFKKR